MIRFRSVDAQGGLIAQQSAIDALIVVGDDERIRALNAPAMGLLGVDAGAQTIGEPLEHLLGLGLDCLSRAQEKATGPIEVVAPSRAPHCRLASTRRSGAAPRPATGPWAAARRMRTTAAMPLWTPC